MEEQKIDLRILRTKKAIEDAFFKELESKDFDHLTISDICKRAMVKRTTFYTHFDDKFQLLEYAINNMLDSFDIKELRNFSLVDTINYYDDSFALLFDFMEKNQQKLSAVVGSNSNSIVVDIFRRNLAKEIKDRIDRWVEKNRPICMPSGIIAEFFAGSIVAMGVGWLQNEFSCTKEEMKKYLKIVAEKLSINKFVK